MLISVGHGRLDREALAALLHAAAVDAVVDIRRYPGSRRNPDVSSEALTQWLPQAGIGYRLEPRLGGRRRLPRGTPCEDPWWRVEQFAAYAAHTRTAEFAAAFTELLDQATRQRPAMMCSESVWWRCHRRLVADVAVLQAGVQVEHLMHDGRQVPHLPADGARVRPDGQVVWDDIRVTH
ncbi:conserved hypothetical protein (plasmid) [Rhodococcus jostii RHA1]|jgi:uncharacterized protein (DUF488 family)|uniref:DUF488 domain-containing protein n=2 Tax=Rhodococcus TaxID=1827 RepID=Q0RZA7_RHOJR|nr:MULTISPECIES: DUF488 domain-containing protein [Rhodococcus]ABG99379.1 conserved hypothetical protein [Rhodococcus jostii RHA1]EID79536.1 hypothetical protein W59_12746 [Rhodococcus opacus RKJ300 = JCM 13270]QQZ18599.1 DUF488 domain-containing protein [Rhodococcus sp. 21391]